jgi:hypothetical protein
LTALAQAPATAPADPSTPQGALVIIARATQAGDADSLRKGFHVTTPDEQKYLDAVAEQAAAMAAIREATVKAFGQEAADRISQNTIDEDRIRAAKATVEGDKATVQVADSPEPYFLVRVGGVWKLSLAKLAAGKNQQIMQQQLDQMKQMSGVMREAAKELGEGKYATPEQLVDGVRAKMIRAMTPQDPATAPAQR